MASYTLLENQLKQKIILIEDTLAKIAAVRKDLKENADFVKEEIRESFCHQLEVLRSRETVLIGQCETLVAAKDDVLSVQQNQLHESLGACRQGLECLLAALKESIDSGDARSAESVEKQVEEILNGLASLELRPRETSSIGVEIDSYNLRRAVQSFGRINLNAMETEAKKKQSLPFALEDYEDEDHRHQLMFKPLQENRQMVLRIPATSPKPHDPSDSDWLFKEALTCRPEHPPIGGRPASMAFSPRGELGHSKSASNLGAVSAVGGHHNQQISAWLLQIKNHVEPEPVVFESFKIAKEDPASVASGEPSADELHQLFEAHFKTIIDSPSKNWLLSSGEWISSPFATLAYFAEAAAQDMKSWLLAKSNQPAVSQASSSASTKFSCGDTTTTGYSNSDYTFCNEEEELDRCDEVSIESLDHLTACFGAGANLKVNYGLLEACEAPLQPEAMFSLSENRFRLESVPWFIIGAGGGFANGLNNNNAWILPDLNRICRANEVCDSLENCVCDENCGDVWYREWLLSNKSQCCNGRRNKIVPAAAPPVTESPCLYATTPTEPEFLQERVDLFCGVRKRIWDAPAANWLLKRSRDLGDDVIADDGQSLESRLKRMRLLPEWESDRIDAWLYRTPVKQEEGGKFENSINEMQNELTKALGWNKLLESVHGKGDADWLFCPARDQSAPSKAANQREATKFGFDEALFTRPLEMDAWLVGGGYGADEKV